VVPSELGWTGSVTLFGRGDRARPGRHGRLRALRALYRRWPVQENVLRVTHVFRRENGEWKIVHRHGDFPPPDQGPPGHYRPDPSGHWSTSEPAGAL